jgi:hypothetical protein
MALFFRLISSGWGERWGGGRGWEKIALTPAGTGIESKAGTLRHVETGGLDLDLIIKAVIEHGGAEG